MRRSRPARTRRPAEHAEPGAGLYRFLARVLTVGLPVALLVAALVLGAGFIQRSFQFQEPPAGQPAPNLAEEAGEQAACPPPTIVEIDRQPGDPEALPDAATARSMLEALEVGERSSGRGYCRTSFGQPNQADYDRNGCGTRQDVLRRQGQDLATTARKGRYGVCEEAVSGRWADPYTGRSLTVENLKDPQQAAIVQIDHMVPLQNAWVSGADQWTPERRAMFAADLARPELFAIEGSVNKEKGSKAPDRWRPAPPFQCDYAKAFTAVKHHYQLRVTAKEKQALAEMLSRCLG